LQSDISFEATYHSGGVACTEQNTMQFTGLLMKIFQVGIVITLGKFNENLIRRRITSSQADSRYKCNSFYSCLLHNFLK